MRDIIQTKHSASVWLVYKPLPPCCPQSHTLWLQVPPGTPPGACTPVSPSVRSRPLSRACCADVVGSLVGLGGSTAAQVWLLPWRSRDPHPTSAAAARFSPAYCIRPSPTPPPHLKNKTSFSYYLFSNFRVLVPLN